MKTLQKSGGIAALYMAISHLIGLVIFIIVLDYINITDPAQKLARNIEKRMGAHASSTTNGRPAACRAPDSQCAGNRFTAPTKE